MARSSKALRRRVLVAFVVASLGAGAPAAAEEASADIDYEAPSECPPKPAFLAEIAARTVTSPDPDRRTFRAVIERSSAGGFDGRLEVSGVARTTHAATCEAVVKTLAVFVVIARTPEPPPDAAVADPPAPLGPPPIAQRRRRPAPKPPPHLPALRYGASVRPSVLVPSVQGPVGSAVRVQSELAWLPPRSVLAPSLRLSFGTASLSKDVDAGAASFRFRTGRAEGCAVIDLGHAFSASPCVGGELGDLVATTSNLPVPVRVSTRWDAVTVGFGVRWAARPWLSVGADVTMLLPLTRRQFGLVDPIRLVYRVPAVYLDMGAVLGVSAYFD